MTQKSTYDPNRFSAPQSYPKAQDSITEGEWTSDDDTDHHTTDTEMSSDDEAETGGIRSLTKPSFEDHDEDSMIHSATQAQVNQAVSANPELLDKIKENIPKIANAAMFGTNVQLPDGYGPRERQKLRYGMEHGDDHIDDSILSQVPVACHATGMHGASEIDESFEPFGDDTAHPQETIDKMTDPFTGEVYDVNVDLPPPAQRVQNQSHNASDCRLAMLQGGRKETEPMPRKQEVLAPEPNGENIHGVSTRSGDIRNIERSYAKNEIYFNRDQDQKSGKMTRHPVNFTGFQDETPYEDYVFYVPPTQRECVDEQATIYTAMPENSNQGQDTEGNMKRRNRISSGLNISKERKVNNRNAPGPDATSAKATGVLPGISDTHSGYNRNQHDTVSHGINLALQSAPEARSKSATTQRVISSHRNDRHNEYVSLSNNATQPTVNTSNKEHDRKSRESNLSQVTGVVNLHNNHHKGRSSSDRSKTDATVRKQRTNSNSVSIQHVDRQTSAKISRMGNLKELNQWLPISKQDIELHHNRHILAALTSIPEEHTFTTHNGLNRVNQLKLDAEGPKARHDAFKNNTNAINTTVRTSGLEGLPLAKATLENANNDRHRQDGKIDVRRVSYEQAPMSLYKHGTQTDVSKSEMVTANQRHASQLPLAPSFHSEQHDHMRSHTGGLSVESQGDHRASIDLHMSTRDTGEAAYEHSAETHLDTQHNLVMMPPTNNVANKSSTKSTRITEETNAMQPAHISSLIALPVTSGVQDTNIAQHTQTGGLYRETQLNTQQVTNHIESSRAISSETSRVASDQIEQTRIGHGAQIHSAHRIDTNHEASNKSEMTSVPRTHVLTEDTSHRVSSNHEASNKSELTTIPHVRMQMADGISVRTESQVDGLKTTDYDMTYYTGPKLCTDHGYLDESKLTGDRMHNYDHSAESRNGQMATSLTDRGKRVDGTTTVSRTVDNIQQNAGSSRLGTGVGEPIVAHSTGPGKNEVPRSHSGQVIIHRDALVSSTMHPGYKQTGDPRSDKVIARANAEDRSYAPRDSLQSDIFNRNTGIRSQPMTPRCITPSNSVPSTPYKKSTRMQ